MPVVMPEETPTQDFKERDAGVSVAAQLTHDTYEIYVPGSALAGSVGTGGSFQGGNNPPSFQMNNGKTGSIVFLRPSYWWNGQLKVEVWWTIDGAGSGTTDVDVNIGTHQKGVAGEVNTLYAGTIAEAYDTQDKIMETSFYTTTALVEEDDLIHVEFASGTNNFCVIAMEIEYKPDFIH